MISHAMLLDFIKTAQSNGITNLSAYLPRNHPLILSNQVRQMRTFNDAVVQGFDELGNRVVLTTQGTVVQY